MNKGPRLCLTGLFGEPSTYPFIGKPAVRACGTHDTEIGDIYTGEKAATLGTHVEFLAALLALLNNAILRPRD